jgi:putative transport protein
MEWFSDLLFKQGVAHTILIYSIVISVGVFLGKIKIKGISLGIAFVLFAGLAVSHFGFTANHDVIDFIRDFGLILFVFSIGLQVGPGFFSSFRKGGLALNILALSVVVLGAGIVIIIHLITGMSMPMLVGVMSGAVTNTPGLGAAQQTLTQVSGGAEVPQIGMGYAVAYPFGVLGIIITMILLKRILKVDIDTELDSYNKTIHPSEQLPERISIQVTSRKVIGETIRDITSTINHPFIISRILHNGDLIAAGSDSVLYENDIVLVVATRGAMPAIIAQIGIESEMDLTAKSGKLISRRILVTNREVFGKRIGSLNLRSKYNINITRIYRAGIELVAEPGLRLQMGDKLTVVGDEGSLGKVIKELGNSIKRLDEPNIIPIFVGILLGVILGSIPFHIPGVSNPVKLGLAGGPLIVALLLSKYGYKFQLVSYTTPSANLMLREIGIVLFLASVGISSGEKFVPALRSGDGVLWMVFGAIITFVPLITVGLFSRLVDRKSVV